MPQTQLSEEELNRQKKEVEIALASKAFLRAPSLARLLAYLCGKYFDGEVDQVKEYTIAVELFKRTADFRSKDDPIVRVEANRLRKKLQEYYRSEGKERPIQISMPSGQYAPVFAPKADGSRKQSKEQAEQGCGADASGRETITHPPPAMTAAIPPEGNQAPLEPNSLPEPAPAGHPQRLWYIVTLSLLALLSIVALTMISARLARRQSPAAAASPSPPVETAIPASSLEMGPEVRIMAGSSLESYSDRLGRLWLGDRYFSGGQVVAASPTALLRAERSHLCKFSRQGEFEYNIPLAPGTYELHLHFVEMLFGVEPEEGGETSRLFDVYANGRPLLQLFDVYSDAGGGGKVDERVFTDISPAADGRLHLSFRPFKDKALVNGIELLPGTPGRMIPVRITTRSSDYLSSDQHLWKSDRYFSGGRSVLRLHPVQAAKDAELYQSERYGNFSYSIPVAQGIYTVTLKFAETYFGLGPTNPPGPGPGMRLFNVFCNGRTLLEDFDIFTEAGAANRSLDRTFHGLKPNEQGKLVLDFVPVKNYSCVNAIEVVPE